MRGNCYSSVFGHLADTILAWQGQWELEQERGKSESEHNVSDRQVLWSTRRMKIGLITKENYADRFLCITFPPIMAVLGGHLWISMSRTTISLPVLLWNGTFASFALLLLWSCWAVCERVWFSSCVPGELNTSLFAGCITPLVFLWIPNTLFYLVWTCVSLGGGGGALQNPFWWLLWKFKF